MTCKPCVEKWIKYYLSKGLSQEQAECMAKKLVRRLEHRIKKRSFFQKLFETNWKATFFWRQWIGKSHNPDYTQNCSGVCATTPCPYSGNDCYSTADCRVLNPTCGRGTCACPAPLPNSSQVSDNCTCQYVGYRCTTCHPLFGYCTDGTYTCGCGGTCGYNCNAGYVWNGTQCALAPVALPRGDGLVWTQV